MMNPTDQRYLKPWLNALGQAKPARLWRDFVSLNDLPPLDFSNAISAVYSANIEGNTIDANSYSPRHTEPDIHC